MTKKASQEYKELIKKHSFEQKALSQIKDESSTEYKKQKGKVDNLKKQLDIKLNETQELDFNRR